MIKALRGMKDILPPVSEKYLHFINTASKLANNFGFEYIETPILEETSLFKRSVGESSDIVGKEMYEFIDKGGNSVCLRPEGTAGVVRSFIEHKFDRKEGIFRYFYYGPMFRYERPQKGRLREFHQFGCETFGEPSVYEDANMIILLKDILDFYNIDYTLKINSLGCEKCMPVYRKKLIEFLDTKEAKICEDCIRRKATNPIRVLDCKVDACKDVYVDAPKLLDNLCEDCKKDFEKLQDILQKNKISYEIDIFLVRGLDYYTKTAFEFVSSSLGSQNAIAGGGRFDRLVEFMGGKPTPAIGFAIGIERILDLIELPQNKREGIYLGVLTENAKDKAFEIATNLRKKQKVIFIYNKKSLKAHLKGADKSNAKFAAIIGEDELEKNSIWVKDLDEKKEEILKIDFFLKKFGEIDV
ncbi:histidine--tRNA ligase [Nitrosophilus kaiyonis]|uniref:histidine--tRNA ligase n=1 Tax=Nitrosophilus kaiyonis TaxID=2930200 RepID=UPI002490089E|nr:histidine--tRNA ligase [Nitrosophilus kaiyonis]